MEKAKETFQQSKKQTKKQSKRLISCRINSEELKEIEKLAKKFKVTRAKAIRRAIDCYINREFTGEEWDNIVKSLEKAEEDIKKGRTKTFDSVDELIKELES